MRRPLLRNLPRFTLCFGCALLTLALAASLAARMGGLGSA
jgi:hypothetical protein